MARLAGLLAIALVATALRAAYLDRPSLYYDEVVVLNLARQASPVALLRLLLETDATRAPLHPLLMQGWVSVFGASSLAARAFGVVCGVLTVVVVERIGRRAFDARTGLWAAFLFAISPMQVRYAQEVRMYALLVLETCLAWDLLLSFRESAPAGRQVAFLACLVTLGYTHPLGLFMAAALGLAYLVDPRGYRLSPGRWAAIQVLAILAIAPWARHYLDHPPEFTVGRLPLKFLIGLPIGYIGGNSLTLPVLAGLIVFGMLRRDEGSGRLVLDRPAPTVALLIWFAFPPLLLFGHSLVSAYPIFGPPRYTLFVGPAYLILVARGLAKLPPPARYFTAAACVVLAWSLIRPLVYAPADKPDWRDAAAHIRRADPRATIVVLVDPPHDLMESVPLRYYLGPQADMITISRALERLARDPKALGPAAWTIVDDWPDGRPKAVPPGDWLARYAPVGSTPKFPGVELVYYRLRPEHEHEHEHEHEPARSAESERRQP